MTTSASISAPGTLTLGTATDNLVRSFLKGCLSPQTRRSYAKALLDLDIFAEGRPLTRALLLDWRETMGKTRAAATVNLRLAAVRLFLRELQRQRRIGGDYAAELLDLKGLPQRGQRSGIWLTGGEAARLLKVPDRSTLRGKRNYCILAILLGCALRRSELSALEVDHLQMRDERWIIENLRGKGGRVRSVAIPTWVKDAIAAWMFAAKIDRGRVIRQLTLDPAGLSDDTIMEIVQKAAKKIGIPDFTPHDLRRTCAKLCRKNGGELEQIQFMLGHSNMTTTERYLGSTQNLKTAVNDSLGF